MINEETSSSPRRAGTGKAPVLKRLTVQIPGSTANLGPGFDTLALALKIYTRLTFELLERNDVTVPLITLKGAIAGSLPSDKDNLIYRVLSNLWYDCPDLLQRVRITIESEIPLGRGLGSSGTAILGTIWASYVLSDRIPDQARLLSEATQIEGHPDNLAASLMGGLVVSARAATGRDIVTQKLAWPEHWRTLVVVPGYSLTTQKARSVLPRQVRLEDAVANVQRVALLVSAVLNRDETALSEALHDKLHEPYRAQLVPELGSLRRRLAGLPVLGCTLSGAGSSVLVLVTERHKAEVLDCLEKWAGAQPEPASVLDLNVDAEGLQELPAAEDFAHG